MPERKKGEKWGSVALLTALSSLFANLVERHILGAPKISTPIVLCFFRIVSG